MTSSCIVVSVGETRNWGTWPARPGYARQQPSSPNRDSSVSPVLYFMSPGLQASNESLPVFRREAFEGAEQGYSPYSYEGFDRRAVMFRQSNQGTPAVGLVLPAFHPPGPAEVPDEFTGGRQGHPHPPGQFADADRLLGQQLREHSAVPCGEPVDVEGLAELRGHIRLGSPEEGGQQGDEAKDIPDVLRLRHLKLRRGTLLRHDTSVYFGYANCSYNHRVEFSD